MAQTYLMKRLNEIVNLFVVASLSFSCAKGQSKLMKMLKILCKLGRILAGVQIAQFEGFHPRRIRRFQSLGFPLVDQHQPVAQRPNPAASAAAILLI